MAAPAEALVRGRSHDTAMLYVKQLRNVALNLTRDDAEERGVVPGSRIELSWPASATTPSLTAFAERAGT